jgi:hypothetical protein
MLHENIAREEAQLKKLARVGTPQAIQMLRQYAQTHQDDAIRLSLANQAVNDAKEMHSKALAMLSGQQPPTVAQQVVQSIGGQGGAPMPPPGGPQGPMPPQGMPAAPPPGMQMPPQAPPPGMQMPPPMPPAPQMPPPSGPGAAPQGLAGLPAQNIQNMADGGIAGYADEDEAVGYADGGEIRMAVGGAGEDAMREQLRSLGYPPALIDRVIADSKAQTPQRDLVSTPAITSGIGVPQIKTQSFGEAMPMPTPIPNPRMTGEAPAVGPNDRNPFISREESPSSGVAPTRTNLGNATDRLPDLRQFATDLEAGRIRAVPGGGIVPMTPGQGSFKDRSLGNREPANQAGAPTAPAAPAQTYAGIYDLVSGGGRPRLSTGTGAGAGVGIKGPPKLTPPDALTPEKAMENVGRFFDPKDVYAQADRAKAEALGRAEETAQFVKLNKPAAPFKKLAEKLDTEEFNEVGEKEKARGMAIMMAGLKMMESPYGGKGLGSFLRNVGAGATEGAKELQKSNKEFKELAQKRMQMRVTIEAAQDAAARGDFDREIALRTRADQIEDSANNNRMRIGEALFNAKGTAALTAFNHSADVIDKYKIAQFGVDAEAYNTQMREAGANARNAATIRASREAELFKAQLPPESIRAAAILGGAKPGETGTPEQIKAGLTLINSEKFNPQTAYSKYVTDWKKDPANPNDRMMTYPEYLAMFGAGKVVDKLPANALVRNPQ